jgi:sensor histidine kinase YesM
MQLKQLLIFIVILIPVYTMAQADSIENSLQKERKYISLQSEYQRGHVFATNDFLRGLNTEYDRIDDFQTFSIKFSTQTTGKKLWEQLYNYPAWGLAIYTADFQAPEEIGYPIAIYGFFNGPFRRWEKVSFNYELGFGATFM